jgi:hypothetical protein
MLVTCSLEAAYLLTPSMLRSAAMAPRGATKPMATGESNPSLNVENLLDLFILCLKLYFYFIATAAKHLLALRPVCPLDGYYQLKYN